ncbi:hypothetical protein CRE_24938 [Caenorhabditis remanei]|uniref:3'-5' exonuclease domain-containing protein n=1 Tax=Caenorhabditis remanei TaxID=31234 RepID=E3MHV2_CAERE|nr:hypothetical protein CRE_24938 [Caenorhabditis remanei]
MNPIPKCGIDRQVALFWRSEEQEWADLQMEVTNEGRIRQQRTLRAHAHDRIQSKEVTVSLNKKEFEAIQEQLNHLRRIIVTFGDEKSFLRPECNKQNIQPRTSPSLKDYVHEVTGLEVLKTETMSNWRVLNLRKDQIWYAAMDTVSLHYLNAHTPRPRSSLLVSTLPHVSTLLSSQFLL